MAQNALNTECSFWVLLSYASYNYSAQRLPTGFKFSKHLRAVTNQVKWVGRKKRVQLRYHAWAHGRSWTHGSPSLCQTGHSIRSSSSLRMAHDGLIGLFFPRVS